MYLPLHRMAKPHAKAVIQANMGMTLPDLGMPVGRARYARTEHWSGGVSDIGRPRAASAGASWGSLTEWPPLGARRRPSRR